MTAKKLVASLLLFVTGTVGAGMPHFNLFNPYDCLMTPIRVTPTVYQVLVAYEYAFHGTAYQAAEDERSNSNCFRKRADVLQLYQNEQDALAALKGAAFGSLRSRLAQKYNINDDDGSLGLFIPRGDFDIHNLMLTARFPFGSFFSWTIHLPIISMHLKHVRWDKAPTSGTESYEDNLPGDFVSELEQIGDMHLRNWERTGLGDLASLVWWERYFPQTRPMLLGTLVYWRTGLTFPTGKKAEGNYMFCPPFGNGGSIGLLGAGHLELYFPHLVHLGLDVELFYLWGRNQNMHIKTNPAQTDLLFLQQACVYERPGFTQHFTITLGAQNFYGSLSAEVDYQFTRQHDTEVYVNSSRINPVLVGMAESLQEWTTHSFICSLTYDMRDYDKPQACQPFCQLLYKHGFNGQRAVLMNSITALIAIEF